MSDNQKSRQVRRHEQRKGGQCGDPPPIKSEDLMRKAGMADPRDRFDSAKWGGKLNIYTCEQCRAHIVTRDVDDGVTPFMLPSSDYCPNRCRSNMLSSMYRVWDQSMLEDFQWYAPKEGEHTIPLALADHVRQGGLLIRKRAD